MYTAFESGYGVRPAALCEQVKTSNFVEQCRHQESFLIPILEFESVILVFLVYFKQVGRVQSPASF